MYPLSNNRRYTFKRSAPHGGGGRCSVWPLLSYHYRATAVTHSNTSRAAWRRRPVVPFRCCHSIIAKAPLHIPTWPRRMAAAAVAVTCVAVLLSCLCIHYPTTAVTHSNVWPWRPWPPWPLWPLLSHKYPLTAVTHSNNGLAATRGRVRPQRAARGRVCGRGRAAASAAAVAARVACRVLVLAYCAAAVCGP